MFRHSVSILQSFLNTIVFRKKLLLIVISAWLPSAILFARSLNAGVFFSAYELATVALAFLVCMLTAASAAARVDTLRLELNSAFESLSGGDFSVRLLQNGTDEAGALARAFNDTVRSLQRRFMRIGDSIAETGHSAQQLKESASSVAERLDTQSENTEMIAAAIEQMSASIAEVANQCRNVEENCRSTQALTQSSKTSIAQLTGALRLLSDDVLSVTDLMRNLEEHSKQITQISEVIKTISDQTNLLALNAAIEAARAGEYGRGFAVVADEVRSLAAGVGRSAEEITGTIESIREKIRQAATSVEQTQSKTREGVKNASILGEALNEIHGYMVTTFDNVSMIATGIEQQSQVSTDIGRRIETISSGVESNARSAQESADIANHLAELTQPFTH